MPNAFLITTSFVRSDARVLTGDWTFENCASLGRCALYANAIIRAFTIGVGVGVLVCYWTSR